MLLNSKIIALSHKPIEAFIAAFITQKFSSVTAEFFSKQGKQTFIIERFKHEVNS